MSVHCGHDELFLRREVSAFNLLNAAQIPPYTIVSFFLIFKDGFAGDLFFGRSRRCGGGGGGAFVPSSGAWFAGVGARYEDHRDQAEEDEKIGLLHGGVSVCCPLCRQCRW